MTVHELADLPGGVANAITAVSVLIAGGGALVYLIKRPHLTGERKFVALMIGLAVGVPLGGVLAAIVAAAILIPACSSGCHMDSEGAPWFIISPLVIGSSIAVMVSASVADGRVQRTNEATKA